jgi:heterotetrameric sarcosine oxidase gamma subunit
VPEYFAKTALEGRAPLDVAGTVLMEVDHGAIASIQPFPGQEKAVAKVLKPLGLSFPTVGEFAVKEGAMILWSGRDQAFLIGADCPDMGKAAAVTDQSGAWVSLDLAGPLADQALARYVPIDLRLSAFAPGRVVRAPLYHMSAVILRLAEDRFRVMVFRSMARTAWHEIEVALKTLAARAA